MRVATALRSARDIVQVIHALERKWYVALGLDESKVTAALLHYWEVD